LACSAVVRLDLDKRTIHCEFDAKTVAKESGLKYLAGIWSSRYFWAHLALSDIRNRWRRSYLGVLWSILQPLGLTALIAFVFGRLFNIDMIDYAPYILSGIVIWDYISGTASAGSLAFVQNEPYIKQYRHPLAIYTLRNAVANMINLAIASIGLIAWVLVFKWDNLSWSWLALPLAIPIAVAIGWPLATALAYLAVRFRDIPHALGLMLQAAWFISPVYFEARFFRDAGLNKLIDYNPIYHLLQTIRAPLLAAQWPTAENYAFCAGTALVLAVIACAIGRRWERKVIFYL
jgi:lipopolysaccharide transport system permease protein